MWRIRRKALIAVSEEAIGWGSRVGQAGSVWFKVLVRWVGLDLDCGWSGAYLRSGTSFFVTT